MKSIDEIFSRVGEFDREKRQLFYFKLGFNLTISILSFAHDPRYDDYERLEGLKSINELSHRNFNLAWRLMYSTELGLDDSYMFEEVKNYCRACPKSSGDILEAVRSSYDHMNRSGTIDHKNG